MKCRAPGSSANHCASCTVLLLRKAHVGGLEGLGEGTGHRSYKRSRVSSSSSIRRRRPCGTATMTSRCSVRTGDRCAKSVLLRLILLAAFGCAALVNGYDPYEEDKRQDLVPFPRLGRTLYSWVDKRQGLVPFPRVGRSVTEGKRQGLIPFPRIGRSVPDSADGWGDFTAALDEDLTESPYTDWGILVLPYKRRSSTFTPRIGRKRRSINQDDANAAKDQDGREMGMAKSYWSDADYSYQRDSRQIIPLPRIGRAFVPRLGKRRDDDIDDVASDSIDGYDRGFYTPRLGRAFTPRIGRAFTPRIGRAFTPRIGRTPFTPRIGRGAGSADDGKASASASSSGTASKAM